MGCECDPEEVITGVWQVCAFTIAVGLFILIDIFALVVAFDGYDTSDECWSAVDSLWVHPATFLKVAGFASIGGIALGIFGKTACSIDETKQDVPRMCFLCFFVVWGVIGFVTVADLASVTECDGQSVGKMIIAWSVVKTIECCCGSM